MQLIENALLDDKDTTVRQSAAAILGEIKAREAIPILKQELNDADTQVAFAAAIALVELGEDRAEMGLFADVLTGRRENVPGKFSAAWARAKERYWRPQELAFTAVNAASGAFLGPGAIGIIAGEEAFKAENPFEDRGAPGRALAAQYLAKEKDPYALTLLEWALDDKNAGVRASAAKSAGERGNTNTLAKLIPLLNDEHTAPRTMAAASIIKLSEAAATAGPEEASR